MRPSQIIPALWTYFFGGAPPVPFEPTASPGASAFRTALSQSRMDTFLSGSLYRAQLAASATRTLLGGSRVWADLVELRVSDLLTEDGDLFALEDTGRRILLES